MPIPSEKKPLPSIEEIILQALAQGGAAADPAGSSSGQPTASSNMNPVYLGTRPLSGIGITPDRVDDTRLTPNLTTVFAGKQWLQDLRANDLASYDQVLDLLRAGNHPYLSKGAKSLSSIEAAWTEALTDAALNRTQSGGTGPAEVLSFLADPVRQSQGTSSSGGASGPYTGPSSRVTFTNPSDAKAYLDNAFDQVLGKNATPEQRADYYRKLHKAEARNPMVDSGGLHDRVTSGGVNPQQIAEDFAKAQPDYVQTQENTTAMNYLQQAILGPPKGEMI